jgi:hypothetical protein
MSSWRRPCTGRHTDIDRAYGALATYVTLHALADAKAIGFTSGEVYKGIVITATTPPAASKGCETTSLRELQGGRKAQQREQPAGRESSQRAEA